MASAKSDSGDPREPRSPEASTTGTSSSPRAPSGGGRTRGPIRQHQRTAGSSDRRRDPPPLTGRQAGKSGAYGDRPRSPFRGLPASEFAILAGAATLIIGLVQQSGLAVVVGVVACLLGVTEVTAREHFSGYRSHTVLLAAIPAVAVEVVVALVIGDSRATALLLVPAAGVFAGCCWFLHRRFVIARQARIEQASKL